MVELAQGTAQDRNLAVMEGDTLTNAPPLAGARKGSRSGSPLFVVEV
jgi:hypothetical protein